MHFKDLFKLIALVSMIVFLALACASSEPKSDFELDVDDDEISVALSEAVARGLMEDLIGADLEAIRIAEDRERFKTAMLAAGLPVPDSRLVRSVTEAREALAAIGYPALVRASRTLGGAGGGVAHQAASVVAVYDGVDNGLKEAGNSFAAVWLASIGQEFNGACDGDFVVAFQYPQVELFLVAEGLVKTASGDSHAV